MQNTNNTTEYLGILDPVIQDKSDLKKYLQAHKLLSLSLKIEAFKDVDQLSFLANMIRSQASLEPSLGIALTMHHHIVLVLAKYPEIFPNATELLDNVLHHDSLIASAFAEGKAGINIFNPSSLISCVNQRVLLNGSKKPCTLSSIADHYVMSTTLNGQLTLINLYAKQQGISIQSFWNLDIFKYCDNNELIFENVHIQQQQRCYLNNEQLSLCLIYGLSLFNYFAVSTYIGISDSLIRTIPDKLKNLESIKIKLIEFQNINDTLLFQIHSICCKALLFEDDLSSILNLRYLVENNLQQIKDFTLNNIGGIEVMKYPIILNLTNHLEMLKYHPTSRFQFYRQFI